MDVLKSQEQCMHHPNTIIWYKNSVYYTLFVFFTRKIRFSPQVEDYFENISNTMCFKNFRTGTLKSQIL